MKNYKHIRVLVTLSLVAWVSGCGSVTPEGMVAARNLDPLNTPPGEIALAIGVPKALKLTDGDAVLRLGFSGGSADSMVQFEETADLSIRPADSGDPVAGSDEERVFVARITPGDASAIAAVQSEIKDLRARGAKGDGTLSIELVGGCYVAAMPARIAVSSWMRTNPDGDFVQLTRGADISQAIGARDAALLRAKFRPCSE